MVQSSPVESREAKAKARRGEARQGKPFLYPALDCFSSIERRLFDGKMMALIGRANRVLSMSFRKFVVRVAGIRWSNGTVERKESRRRGIVSPGGKTSRALAGALAGMIGGCGMLLYYLVESSVKAMGLTISLPSYPWSFNGVLTSFDHAALRRGWIVYRNVCRTCHSLESVRFLDLVDVTHTMEEVKEIAAEFEVEDGPNEEGNYYTRPAKLSDKVPSPYPNEQAARAANFGSYPPDLTYIVLARARGIDYLFSLLTGWIDPPAGIHPEEGQYFNIYFPGGFTSMAQMFYEGMVDYDDGTPATDSQMAKDVVEFLAWAASPELDTRKIMTLKCTVIFLILTLAFLHVNRRNWSHLRSRRLAYVPNAVTGDPRPPAFQLGESADKRSKKSGALPNR